MFASVGIIILTEVTADSETGRPVPTFLAKRSLPCLWERFIKTARHFRGMEYVTPDEMRRAEEKAIAAGVDVETLMENAGKAVASVIEDRYGSAKSRRVMVLSGTGNNGGDGFVAARYLKKLRWNVLVLLLGTPFRLKTPEASKNWERVERLVISVDSVEGLRAHSKYFDRADVIVDALLGTGAKGGIREPMATAVDTANSARAAKVSVDVPSGLDPLTGEAEGDVVRADLTISLHRTKTGLRGRDEYTGEIMVVPIGIDG
jgi:hydroxyethylthiazole kinase-like uncharacterized protein yjeF